MNKTLDDKLPCPFMVKEGEIEVVYKCGYNKKCDHQVQYGSEIKYCDRKLR